MTTFELAVTEAIQARLELQALRLEADSRPVIAVTRADTAVGEFIGLFGLSVRNPQNFADFAFARWSAGVTLTVPLFDAHRTAGRCAQAEADRNIVTQRIAAPENEVTPNVQSAWDSLSLADRTLVAADLNVAQARRVVEMTGANYKLGAVTPLDVLDAQQSLALAENIRNQALFSHANARASLSFVMGRDPLTDSPTVVSVEPVKDVR